MGGCCREIEKEAEQASYGLAGRKLNFMKSGIFFDAALINRLADAKPA
jgi:hypothetical protein